MNQRVVSILVLLILAVTILACGPCSQFGLLTGEPTPTEPRVVADTPVPPATLPPRPQPGGAIRQWAIFAVASSEYGNPDWSAMQATGAPDTPECGDYITAWASSASSTEEWIELTYETPVHPTEVNIVQSYNPNQVVKVELIDSASEYHEIYTGRPQQVGQCPFVLSIQVPRVEYAVGGIRITIDQSEIQDWNEIDAVELVGVPAG